MATEESPIVLYNIGMSKREEEVVERIVDYMIDEIEIIDETVQEFKALEWANLMYNKACELTNTSLNDEDKEKLIKQMAGGIRSCSSYTNWKVRDEEVAVSVVECGCWDLVKEMGKLWV